MAVNLTTVHFLAFVLAAGVCCMLIQSTVAQDGSNPGTTDTDEHSTTPAGTSLPITSLPTTSLPTTTTPAPTTPTPVDGYCTTGINCINNLTCIGGTCGCDTNTSYYESSTQSCVLRKHYGESCNASVPNVCLDLNTNCKKTMSDSSTKCLCIDTFYKPDSGVCLSDDNLLITINSVSTTKNNATLTWTDNTKRNNVNFTITSNSSSSSTKTFSVGKVNQVVVSDLTAGNEYTFSVTSVLPADGDYNEKQKGGYGYKIYTKPSAPVGVAWNLDASRSSESQFVYTATITKGGGNAANFLFTLVGPGVTSQPVTVPNTSGQTVTTSFILVLEQTYSYTVVAQNNDGNLSQPLNGTYKPKNEAAKNVSNVRLNSSLVRDSNQVKLLITWQPGDITGITTYYIQVQEAADKGGTGIGEVNYYQVQGYNNTSYTIPNVRAYWFYKASVMAGTSGGNSSWVSAAAQNRTVESAANSITDLTLASTRDASTNMVNLNISWTAGNFTGVTTYYIKIQEVVGSGLRDFLITSVTGYDSTSYTVKEITPSTTYNVSVSAGTSAGNSSWVSAQNKTAESSAQSISDLMLNSSRDPNGDRIQMFISWKPGNYSGDTTYYIVVEEATDSTGDQFASFKSYVAIGYNTTFYNVADDLRPYWYYNVSVVAGTSTGNSSGMSEKIRTAESFAKDVININVTSTRDANTKQVNLLVKWEPGVLTGITTYYILVQLLGGDQRIREISVPGYESKNNTVSDVLAFSNYNVSIKAGTSVGNSSWVSQQVITAESCPGKVEQFNVTQLPEKAKNIKVSFSCPLERNGIIQNVTIRYNILNSNFSNEVTCNAGCGDTLRNVIIQNVTVGETYTFSINAETKACPGPFIQTNHTSEPKKPILEDVVKEFGFLVKPEANSQSTEKVSTIVSPNGLLDDSQGNVTDVGLIICVKESSTSCATTGRRKREAASFKDYITWAKAKENNFKNFYRTTPDDWKQTLNKKNMEQEYIIGDNTSCRTGDENHCNGPLPSGKKFLVQVIVCTNGGCSVYSDDDKVFSTQPTPETAVGAIVGGVLGGLALLAVIGVIFLVWHFRRRNNNNHSRKSSQRLPQIVERRPVKMRDFNDHVSRFHKDSNLLFQDEYDNIQTLSKSFTYSTNDAQNEANKIKNRYNESTKLTHFEAQKEANRVKNRYVDILPFDHTRVKLSTLPEDDDTNDFINANYIPGYSSPREYIASQGPMHCTFPDFWKMIWEQNSRIIVMLSDLVEAGKRKVDMYWPENLNEPINYGSVVVEMTNFSQLNKEIIRNFTMTKGEETRKVMHFFMPEWPDFGAKIGKERLIDFIKLVRQEVKPSTSQGPIIVHCSAGVGRTGTYIAIDYFMQFVEKHSLDEEMDVFDFVLTMRRHRPRMVQVENQYIFIHDVINKLIQKKIQEEKMKEERIYENTNGIELTNGNIYANYNQEENIYANGQVKGNRYEYSNDAFEPDLPSDTTLLSEKPLTEL